MTLTAASRAATGVPAQGAEQDMVWVASGEFRMGADHHYPEEAPAHRVRVDGFFIDRHPVTSRQFAAFVAATGYRTVAERPSIRRTTPAPRRAC